jgi:hypothetical protein
MRDMPYDQTFGRLMRWQSAWLVALCGIELATAVGCAEGTIAACPAGPSQFSASEIALRLDFRDDGNAYRLPLGKVVIAPSGVCGTGDAIEAIGNEALSNTPSPSFGVPQAFRAVRTGVSSIAEPGCTGGACGQRLNVDVTVTNGCQPLSRSDAISLFMKRYPHGVGNGEISTKLILASEYEQLFGTALDLMPNTLVWAVLVATRNLDPAEPTVWTANAIVACTDWMSDQWTATSEPGGWSSLTDQGGATH